MVICQQNLCASILRVEHSSADISTHQSLGDEITACGEDGRPRTVAGGVDDMCAAYVDRLL